MIDLKIRLLKERKEKYCQNCRKVFKEMKDLKWIKDSKMMYRWINFLKW